MKIQTSLLGELEIDENLMITFNDGIPGFDHEKNFAILPMDDSNGPFFYLQSVTNSDLCLIIADPFTFFPDYEMDIADVELAKIGVEAGSNIIIYVILTIPEDFRLTTANLLAPVVINTENRQAMQYIAAKTGYTTRHLIFRPQKQTAAAGEGR